MLYNPIPTVVVKKIMEHRPDLKNLCNNYLEEMFDNHILRACQIGNTIANTYLCGETRLSVQETLKLSHHCRRNDEYKGYGK